MLLGRISLSIKIGKKKNLVDAGNLTAPQPNLTLIFEEGYSVEIERLSIKFILVELLHPILLL